MADEYRLSPQQEVLWGLQPSNGSTPFFSLVALRLSGTVDKSVLQSALRDVGARYEILRTRFPAKAGLKVPIQAIDGEFHPELTEFDLSRQSLEEQQAEITARLDADEMTFQFSQSPLWQTELYRLSAEAGIDQHILLLSFPALCADAFAAERVAREVAAAYGEKDSGIPRDAEAPVQFADLAEWQHELLESEEMDGGRRFWRQQKIDGVHGWLGGTRVWTGEMTRARRHRVSVPGGLGERLASLGASQGLSVSGFLQASWTALLWWRGDRVAPAILQLCDGRSYEELLDAVGLLGRFLPVRLELDAKDSFAQLWKAQEAHSAEIYEWQEYYSVAVSSAEGAPRLPLAVEVLSWSSEWTDNEGSLRWQPLALRGAIEPFGLKLSALLFPDSSLRLALDYVEAFIAPAEVERLAGQFALLLEKLADAPETRLGEWMLLTETEEQELLFDFHHRQSLPDVTMHELFERQVALGEDRLALVYEELQLTYGSLDRHAEVLAARLHRDRLGGSTGEAVVGICLDRSERMLIAMLGTLKAGAAYLPIAPTLPEARWCYMLQQSGVRVVITEEGQLPGLGDDFHRLDFEPSAALDDVVDRVGVSVSGARLAYVLFTSGSTGQPKGVMVEHRQLTHYVRAVLQVLPEAAYYATVSTFAADLGNTVVFTALAQGAALHVVAESRLFDPDGFAAYMSARRVETLKIVPSHLEALTSVGRTERALPRRTLVLGGEAARPEWLARLQSAAPDVAVINHYGPTETTVGVLTHRLTRSPGAERAGASPPLGRPLANVRVYVLDPTGRPLPSWLAGEITIGGAQVSRGYTGSPSVTADRFVPDGLNPVAGARRYRSGDLGRFRPDGTIEFLGRLDDQVKIHGFRVELGEVAAALAERPGVAEAVVLARDDGAGQMRLVAYVVSSGPTLERDDLRAGLLETLPEYMLPAAFVTLEKLPRNANGKIDRQRLPAPDPMQLRQGEFVAPRNTAETALAEIWSEVLGLEQIGVHDNFFHIGGDSIRSIEVRAKAKRRGLNFSIADLFQHQTIGRLCHFLEDEAEDQDIAALEETIDYRPFMLLSDEDRERIADGIEDAYPLGMMQQGMLFHSLQSTDEATYHDVGSYRFRVAYDPEAFRQATRILVARHSALRTSIDYGTFSTPLQLVHAEAEIPVELGDWRHLDPEDETAAWDAWIDQETKNSFDWKRPPLLRTYLHQLRDGGCQITVSFHHAILDGWSRHSMVTELIGEYLRLLDFDIPDLPVLPALSYGEFVALEKRALDAEVSQSYWREQLEDAPRVVLPRRPVAEDTSGGLLARVHITNLPERLSEKLHALSRRLSTPIKSLLLAAHFKMLATLTGQDDVTTGLVVNGRPEKDAGDRVFGLFLNSVPLRQRLTVGSWAELVRSVFAAEGRVIPFRRFPIAELQRLYGGRERLLEVNFNYMHYHIYRRVLELPGLDFLDYRGFEETNLTCVINFHQDPLTEDIQLGIEYHAAILFEEQVIHMSRYLLSALWEMAEHPDDPHEGFVPLSAAERHQLLYAWNDSAWTDVPGHEGSLVDLIAERVAENPGRTALEFAGQRMTYEEVWRASGKLAMRLTTKGVGAEERVAILAERSLELVTGLVAVLRSGAAYVPLDTEIPTQRLRALLDDIGPRVLLSQKGHRERLQEYAGEVLWLDEDTDGTLSDAVPAFTASEIRGNQAAYVIYTSGSTGRPKGVVNTHRGIVNRLLWMQRTYQLTDSDRVLQKTPYTFDVSVWEFFWPLMAGARLVVAAPGGHRDGAYLKTMIRDQEITTLHFVPSMLRVFLEQNDLGLACRSLRQVICSGEALPREVAARTCAELGVEVHNLYGPTEAAIDVSAWRYRSGLVEPTVPIGRPIANLRLTVLDQRLRPLPIGVAGELRISGTGLARGYWKRPGLTADRFLPDAFAVEPGDRAYRTGDLVRLRPDGGIEFLNRLDHQIKIRGLRVELGEIEAALRACDGVRDAVVLVRGQDLDQRLIAYVVTTIEETEEGMADREIDSTVLREALRRSLPEYMVPSFWVGLSALPLTTSGKLDRRALPEPGSARSAEVVHRDPINPLERTIAEVWREVLGLEQVSTKANFFDLGGHSLHLVRIHVRLRELLNRDIAMVDLFTYPTIRALSEYLAADLSQDVLKESRQRAERRRQGRSDQERIAIVGLQCRLPGADDANAFWHNLEQGVESVQFMSEDEMLAAGVDPEILALPGYIRAKGTLEDIDLFDAEFFQYSPMDASLLDPQQRLFLEIGWQALEDAGYVGDRDGRSTAVFAGIGMNTYAFNLYSNRSLVQSVGGYQTMLANDKDFLATRLAYKFDLRGPAMTVQTACSTSLVAIHLACQSLLSGECDLALAGGVRVAVPHKSGYLHQEGGIHSADGHCRAFDAGSSGTVGGDGVAAVVLKRLSDALADGDTVRAVILGSAINNDGARRVGYTAPGVQGQAAVISEALQMAGVDARSISYVEAHGTGTELGDPIEVAALTQAYRDTTDDTGFCALGSLKTNIGHLDAAAGAAGVIKTVLALENDLLPASLHYEQPNPRIDFESSPFYVNGQSRPWTKLEGQPRRAGVSSMGIGGTNAHLILEEAPSIPVTGASREWQVLRLSAKNPEALEQMAGSLADALERSPDLPLADVAFTLQAGRRDFEHRQAVVCRDIAQAVRGLRGDDRKRFWRQRSGRQEPAIAFLFPGQGAQYVQMAAGLYRSEKVFRREVDRCAEYLLPDLGVDIRRWLYPSPADAEGAAERVQRTELAQASLFTVSWAMAELWRSWKILPTAFLGHSVGELVAATQAGLWSLPDGLALVAARGRGMQQMPPGSMLSVQAGAEILAEHVEGLDVVMASENGPELNVVSGASQAIETLAQRLASAEISHRRLHTSHAFHSAMMDEAVEPFVARVAEVSANPPTLPWVSNVTGTWIRPDEARDPAYWGRHLRSPVRFGAGLETLLAEPSRVLLEVGPGRSLSGLARRHPAFDRDRQSFYSLRHPQEEIADEEHLARTVARLWVAGAEVSKDSYFADETRRRVSLPGYAYTRQRYWIDAPQRVDGQDPLSLERIESVKGWFFAPAWERCALSKDDFGEATPACLVFVDQGGIGAAVAEALRQRGCRVVEVRCGDAFADQLEDGTRWTLDPQHAAQFAALFEALTASEFKPERVVYTWPLDDEPSRSQVALLHLVRQLDHVLPGHPVDIFALARGLFAVGEEEMVDPALTPLSALVRVISQEWPQLPCHGIDIAVPSAGSFRYQQMVGQLADEVLAARTDGAVAWRGSERWREHFEPSLRSNGLSGLRPGGSYALLGGLTGMNRALCGWLSRTAGAKRILWIDETLPDPASWSAQSAQAQVAAMIEVADAVRASETEFDTLCGEDARGPRMGPALQAWVDAHGPLDGAFLAAGGEDAGAIPLSELDPQVWQTGLAEQQRRLDLWIPALTGRVSGFVLGVASNAAILGGLGAAASAAMSAQLVAAVRQQGNQAEIPWTSVCWDYRAAIDREGSHLDVRNPYDMSDDEGYEVLARLMASTDCPFLAVSPVDLRARMRVWVAGDAEAVTATIQSPRPDLDTEWVAPSDPIEEEIAGLWCELLGLERVGVHDDFFELGGHSLLATQLASRLRATFHATFSLRKLFEASTIADQARLLVEEQLRTTDESELSTLLAEVESLAPAELEALLTSEKQRHNN